MSFGYGNSKNTEGSPSTLTSFGSETDAFRLPDKKSVRSAPRTFKTSQRGLRDSQSQNYRPHDLSDSQKSYVSKISFLNSDIYQEPDSDLQELFKFSQHESPSNRINYDATDDDELYLSDEDLINFQPVTTVSSYMDAMRANAVREVYSLICMSGVMPESKNSMEVLCEICKDEEDLIQIPTKIFGNGSCWKTEKTRVETTKSGVKIAIAGSYCIAPCCHVYHTNCLSTWRPNISFCPSCETCIGPVISGSYS